MTAHAQRVRIELNDVDLDTPSGRPLIRGLSMSLAAGERAALIGRNGAGKSSLLAALAGDRALAGGELRHHGTLALVRQRPSPSEALQIAAELDALRRGQDPSGPTPRELARLLAGSGLELDTLAALDPLDRADVSRLSGGEVRKLHLAAALLARPDLLMLDEPSEDLDAAGRAWLERQLRPWPGALLVVSHDRQLLGQFEHFFVLAESGCRYRHGDHEHLAAELDSEQAALDRRYAERLSTLAAAERDRALDEARRRRKQNLGRVRELRRRSPRALLNQKRSDAQQSRARAARIRDERAAAMRGWAAAARRALRVKLPLDALTITLPDPPARPLLRLRDVGASVAGRALFRGLDLDVGRERVAITGANGSGKTTLLEIMLGARAPTSGVADVERTSVGVIGQAALDWASEDSLLERLLSGPDAGPGTLDAAAQALVAHGFPFALAERPLASLSPGERARAALICLFRRQPPPQLLVLDEPTFSLDALGRDALASALRRWPGGLVVASHDHDFLDAVGFDVRVELGRLGDGDGCVVNA
ncbi:ABC-F family ATP-binding cassette domain-containing protein [Pseudenhygromyxa sp. WMMC2535]|uniref:ATP-binding cassette domain-containing protein n=1 Tax=Pseudenhygromyxa sp. WMMC2535 TaxID=2712867 RepID=UPI0015521C91|nr:ATP-binding cassette domain-containing protein [Pseudenhygromyxa sp. WMMC2535]NVB42678.1 ABC-F family ATP-binding cassette domain-containing protein [Pseudenhygromyxa sp. WMMC2535]